MDMILRPALYQAQHPIYHYSLQQQQWSTFWEHHYVIVGHCCESTDLLSPDSSGNISTRGFNQRIERWDIIVIGWCGAYCESMRCIGYNGF
jgi:diaminopimelate decarboxylase